MLKSIEIDLKNVSFYEILILMASPKNENSRNFRMKNYGSKIFRMFQVATECIMSAQRHKSIHRAKVIRYLESYWFMLNANLRKDVKATKISPDLLYDKCGM